MPALARTSRVALIAPDSIPFCIRTRLRCCIGVVCYIRVRHNFDVLLRVCVYRLSRLSRLSVYLGWALFRGYALPNKGGAATNMQAVELLCFWCIEDALRGVVESNR